MGRLWAVLVKALHEEFYSPGAVEALLLPYLKALPKLSACGKAHPGGPAFARKLAPAATTDFCPRQVILCGFYAKGKLHQEC